MKHETFVKKKKIIFGYYENRKDVIVMADKTVLSGWINFDWTVERALYYIRVRVLTKGTTVVDYYCDSINDAVHIVWHVRITTSIATNDDSNVYSAEL